MALVVVGEGSSQERTGWNGVAVDFSYDAAGRLTEAARPEGRTLSVAVPDRFAFTYDAAENLLARTEEGFLGTTATTALPLDGSGRNRPDAIDGTALSWDAAGNLADKGGLGLHYDFGNRLVRVSNATGTVGAYEYDAFNRRVRRTAGGRTIETVWSGWQSLEDYVDGTLSERHVYGLELDEVVRTERDTTGDGVPDQSHHLLYDSIGNVALALTGTGLPIERYEYSPYGERWVVVNDLTPPVIEQIRVVGDELWLEMPEEVSLARLEAAVAAGELGLVETATSAPIAVTVAQPVQEGPLARRRVVLAPATAPGAGVEVRLEVAAGTLADTFGNAAGELEEVFAWTPGVVADASPPQVVAVAVADGRLRLTFSESTDPAGAAAHLQVDGAATTWTLAADGYTLVDDATLDAGGHSVAIGPALADLSGTAIGAPVDWSFTTTGGESDLVVYQAPDPDLLPYSTVGSGFGLHGRPVDDESGLAYFRNRYFDAEMGRFVTVDPLGYVDGPNTSLYALNGPVNWKDVLGLEEPSVRPRPSAEMQRESQKNLHRLELFFSTFAWRIADVANTDVRVVPRASTKVFGTLAGTTRGIADCVLHPGICTTWLGGEIADLPAASELRDALVNEWDRFVDLPEEEHIKLWANPTADMTVAFATGSIVSGQGAGLAAERQFAVGGSATAPRGTAGQGFRSFSSFKRAQGAAGEGRQWHHIVEQTPGNVSRFGPEAVHNTQNLMRLDVATHRQISAYYSRIQPFTEGQRVRQWLSTQPLSVQREFGLQVLRDFGVAP